ncbi:MAG TPA: hypothetical protein VII95_02150 [Terriglobales bacterium]
MKNILILVICMLLSAGVLFASTSSLPTNLKAQLAIGPQVADGGPQPVCAPGRHCNNDQLQPEVADGGPAPYCAPGHHYNDGQLLPQVADGGPAPYCAPGHHCNNGQERLLMAL